MNWDLIIKQYREFLFSSMYGDILNIENNFWPTFFLGVPKLYDDWDVVEKHLNSLKYSIQSFKFIASPIQTPHYLASATGREWKKKKRCELQTVSAKG